ncbi:hypothetical protein [Arthrobacter sp. NEB 688]|uniref:bpX5 domain-containing protein n=1 Tax=Arthrobacter sp. NEB 688 TaxID=904039 RepID=UPI00336BEEA0
MTPTGDWRPREPPLQPTAVLAQGRAVPGLAAAAARGVADRHLRAAGGPSALLLLGAADVLPWAEGVIYLGHASGVLVPTTLANDSHPALAAAALRQRFGARRFVVLPGAVFGFDIATEPVDIGWLTALAEQGAA